MPRRVLTWVMLLIALTAAAACAAEPCRFVVMGDCRPQWGHSDKVTPPPMYQRAIDETNLLLPEFVVILGDLIYGYDDDMTLIQQEWDAFQEATARFQVPVYLVPGNHDIWNDASEKEYQRRHGPLWYSFDVKDCHFIVLDSEDQTAPQQIAGQQLEWLKSDLEAAKGKRIFVLLHQPLWAEDGKEPPGDLWDRDVHPLLAAAAVDTVFAGHWHCYTMMPTRDGVRYIITGGAGAEIGPSPLRGDFYHYLRVTAPPVGEGQARLAVIRTGNVDPQEVVTTADHDAAVFLFRQLTLPPIAVGTQPVKVPVSLRVQNPFPQVTTGTMLFARGAGWQVTPRRSEFRLEPGGGVTLRFEVSADPANIEKPLPYMIDFQVAGRAGAHAERSLQTQPAEE